MVAMVFILVVLALFWIATILEIHVFGRPVSKAVSACPKCGGGTTLTSSTVYSRLEVRCRDVACGHRWFHPVRSSATTVFGISQILLIALAGILGYELAAGIGFGAPISVVGVVAGVIFGGIAARFVMIAVATSLQNVSPAWQEEFVAYLAPPSWRLDMARQIRPEEFETDAEPAEAQPHHSQGPQDVGPASR